MKRPNFKPNTIWTRDNLEVMRGINSECVDLIYLDPPFQPGANYAAPIGSKTAKNEFKEVWTLNEIDIEWLNLISKKHENLYNIINSSLKDSNKSYLCYMAIRILEMRRILKPTGSIFLHCDPTMSHWLKIIMDCIFGYKNFQNEIIWLYGLGGASPKRYSEKHDVILFYTKTKDYYFDKPEEEATSHRMAGQLKGMRDVWTDIPSINNKAKERTGHKTQKPLALLERIIEASSKKNNLIFDPFCGCTTTLIAAIKLKRNWIGIDISPKAVELIDMRMKKEFPSCTYKKIVRNDVPQRTDLGKLPAPRKHLAELYGEQSGYCICGIHFEAKNMEVDHIIDIDSGGTDHKDNLQLLCNSCNKIKGNRGMMYLMKKLSEIKGDDWMKDNPFMELMIKKGNI